MEKTLRRTIVSVSKEAVFILLTVVAAVLLPQVCHGVGVTLGVGGKLGQMLLPMYLPVMLIGFSRGKTAGALAGLAAPLVSFALTAMPSATLLPFITLELAVTGLLAGAFSDGKLPAVCRVFAVQAIAKIVRLGAFGAALYAASGTVTTSVLLADILTAWPGVVLQWIVVGAYLTKRGNRHV